jgi:hypothetical protein
MPYPVDSEDHVNDTGGVLNSKYHNNFLDHAGVELLQSLNRPPQIRLQADTSLVGKLCMNKTGITILAISMAMCVFVTMAIVCIVYTRLRHHTRYTNDRPLNVCSWLHWPMRPNTQQISHAQAKPAW